MTHRDGTDQMNRSLDWMGWDRMGGWMDGMDGSLDAEHLMLLMIDTRSSSCLRVIEGRDAQDLCQECKVRHSFCSLLEIYLES